MLAFRARYVFPIDRPPLRDAVVAIDHDRIVAVGDASSPAIRDLLPGVRDLGEVAILPGLVNPHTHLEFSDLDRPLGKPGMSFPDWIRLVVKYRRELSQTAEPITRGIAEATQSGVTTLGEIASSPWHRSAAFPLEITEFCEVICFRTDRDQQRVQIALDAVGAGQKGSSQTIPWSESFRHGISPHAPYSVRPEIIKQCVELSARHKIPLAFHLAESRDELRLLRDASGPMVDLLQDFGQWDAHATKPNSRPLDYLRMLANADRALVIHGNYLDDEEIEFLAAHTGNVFVVYCPRTHAYFQHKPYPLAKMLSAGLNVAIGTDSRASNPDLSVIEDMRFAAKQHPLVSPAVLLRMITIDAAQALGRHDDIGTLTPGKFADLAILRLPPNDATDPHELLLDPGSQVVTTVFRGRAVYGEQMLFAKGDAGI